MNTLLDEWKRYEAEVIPSDAPPVQRQETCLSFFAGAFALMVLQQRNRDQSDVAVTALQQSWARECAAISEAYANGKFIP